MVFLLKLILIPNAKSDGANMLHLDYFEDLMTKLVAIRKL
jgi:3-deoxy-D-manno-octulosonic acid (KDO) 8-phosphate synthase